MGWRVAGKLDVWALRCLLWAPFWLNPVFTSFLPTSSLQEIRQLQNKQAGLSREIADLQETIEWKDKKIGVGDAGLAALYWTLTREGLVCKLACSACIGTES